jgi:hypothetical protein
MTKQQKEKRRKAERELQPLPPMTKLKYYIHDEPDALRIEIAGDLSGAAVGSLESAWRTANSVLDRRQLIIGLSAFAEADDDGRGLLAKWHRSGARIIARTADSSLLAEGILGAPVRIAPGRTARRRLIDLLLRRPAPAAY